MENSTVAQTNVSARNISMFDLYSPLETIQIAAPHIVLIDRTISPIWYLIGFVGNQISAVIWLSRTVSKTNSSAVYFGYLAVAETIFLILHLMYELQVAWGINTYHGTVLCEVFNVLFITPQYLVPMLVLGFTTERYIAICHPFVKEKYCTVQKAKIVILCTAILALILGLVQVYIWTWDSKLGCVYRYQHSEFVLFHSWWNWLTETLIFAIIPFACLLINILVVVEINRIAVHSAAFGQTAVSGNAASTVTLLSVSFYFIFTQLPATVVYAMGTSIPQGDQYMPIQEWSNDKIWRNYFVYLTVRKVVEELCLSNFATYFFIYYATGVYFREELMNLYGIRKLWNTKRKANKVRLSDYNNIVRSNNKNLLCAETVAMDYHSDCR